MLIRIVGVQLPGRECGASGDFPGYSNIHVGVQRKNCREELLDLHPGDAATAVWTFDCAVDGTDVRGPYVQGPGGGRFIYLSWGTVDDAGHFTLFSEPERVIPIIKHFLEKPEKQLPLATANVGYHPGETR